MSKHITVTINTVLPPVEFHTKEVEEQEEIEESEDGEYEDQ